MYISNRTNLGMTSTEQMIFAGIEVAVRVAMEAVVKAHGKEPPAKLRPMIVEAGLTAASLAGLNRNDPELKERINRIADALMPATTGAGAKPGQESSLVPDIGGFGWKPIAIAAGVVVIGYFLLKKKG